MELSLFQKILLATDGTVTDLLALYTGETIRVVKLEHTVSEREAPAMLACEGATALMSRKILLTAGGKNCLHAESLFVLGRMLPSIREQLLESDRPIGLLWKEARLETYREIVAQKIGVNAAIAGYFGLPETAEFVSRTYVIHNNGKPLGAITEQWPLSLFRDGDVSRGA